MGSRTRISDTAAAEVQRSQESAAETLFSVTRVDGLPVYSRAGTIVAHAVDVLVTCRGGRIAYFIVRTGGVGGVGETLRRLPWAEITMADAGICARLSDEAVGRLPEATSDPAADQAD